MEQVQAYISRIQGARDFLQKKLGEVPRYGMVLGTGSQQLVAALEDSYCIPYASIPHFQPPTAPLHGAQLHVGKLYGKQVLLMDGRYHYYEGYNMQEVTFPIRVLGALGVDTLLLTNAAGGLVTGMQKSELMLVTDHINLQPENPLRGANLDTYGPRFPDMSAPYDGVLCAAAKQVAVAQQLPLREGVYVAVQGPQLETPAEYAYLTQIGAHAVGMSTVPEVLVARHMGMRCCAISIISDICYPGALEVVEVSAIFAAVAAAQPHLQALICGILQKEATPN